MDIKKNNMKQTAVEFLKEKLTYIFVNDKSFNELFQQAKDMEKQQKEDFFNAGVRYGSCSVMSTELGEDTEEYNFEQYYNETFKSE
jgi:hypothetical protein